MFFDRTELEIPVSLSQSDKKKCSIIAGVICLQCVIVCIGAATVLACVWTPDRSTHDYNKLARIMYLFDSQACGYKLKKPKVVADLQLSNETYDLDVLPVKQLRVITTVSTRLSSSTRKYMALSSAFHVIWFIFAIAFRFISKITTRERTLKTTLVIFYYICVFMILFDISMALVYITHIKQSLSKGMILRYSGWATELELTTYDDFAGWLPMGASVCWLRGVIILMLNIYLCRQIRLIKRTIVTRVFTEKLYNERYQPFPEAEQVEAEDRKVLVYRIGEYLWTEKKRNK